MKLYLITHAHTAQVPDMDVTRWVLSEQGVEQARQLAQQPFWDEVGQIALSLEEKTYLTVESVLANREVVYFHDRRFNELKRGGWVGNYAERVQQAFGKPDEAAGDWEPASHALQRFQKGMADLCQKYAEETVAVVGHGLTMSLYRASLLGYDQVRFEDWQELSFASVALVDPVNEVLLEDFVAVAGHMPRR